MPQIHVDIDVIENKIQRAINIGQKRYSDVTADEQTEYDRILKNIGFRVLTEYRNKGNE